MRVGPSSRRRSAFRVALRALAQLYIGAEWTSLRDRAFLGRLWLAAFLLTLAAAGDWIAPWGFVGLVAAAVLAQLLLEAFTVRPGAETVLEPLTTQRAVSAARHHQPACGP
jgi:hypothetical protein